MDAAYAPELWNNFRKLPLSGPAFCGYRQEVSRFLPATAYEPDSFWLLLPDIPYHLLRLYTEIWYGSQQELPDIQTVSIPETETVVAVIAIGKAAEEPARPKRKDVEDIVKFF